MVAVEELKILVEADVSDAIASLERLERKLSELADKIAQVDARGTEGIDVNTSLDGLDAELATAATKLEAFEQSQSVDVPMDVNTYQDDMLAGFQQMAQAGDFDFGRGDFEYRMRGRIHRLSSTLDDLAPSLTDFNLRMSDIHNALAALVPLLIVMIGVVPTVITAFYTIAAAAYTAAAALGAIGALGLLGAAGEGMEMPSGEDITEELRKIVDYFWEAFAPLAEQLAPTFESGLDGLQVLFEEIAAQGDALIALRDEAREFGQYLIDFLPSALRTLAGVVEAMAPLFGQMGQFLDNNFRSIVADLVRVTIEAAPALASLATSVGKIFMALSEMGVGFAVVLNTLLNVIGAFGSLLSFLGITNEQIGLVVGALLSMGTIVALLNSQLITFAGRVLWAAITSLFGLMKSAIASSAALRTLAASSLLSTGSLAALMTVASLGALAGLAIVAMNVAGNFFSMADGIDQAASSLENFQNVANDTRGTNMNPYAPDPTEARASSYSGGGGGTQISYAPTGSPNQDKSNLDKTVWRSNRTS